MESQSLLTQKSLEQKQTINKLDYEVSVNKTAEFKTLKIRLRRGKQAKLPVRSFVNKKC